MNFSNTAISWNSTHTVVAGAGQTDLYTTVLHEMTHSLGFGSLISKYGTSVYGASNNYYSDYDKFLRNPSGTYLLSSSGCSSQYGLAFSTSTTNLQPACPCPICYATDATTCSTACNYNSALVPNMPVYTPNCYESGSSLSHFEDMCYPTNTATNNNTYFTMSNLTSPGTSKRYLKEEERYVLCDLGYYVSNTFTSNAASATHSYSAASACSSPTVWGLNDGITNSLFSYTSGGGAINISTVSVKANDSPTTVSVTCVETVYNNGTVSVSSGSIIFTPAANYYGLVLLRYIPVDASANQGNITYIFAYVAQASCTPVSACDLVQNGNFESHIGCGAIGGGTVSNSCWTPFTLTPDLFFRGCTTSTPSADLGASTYSSTISSSLTPFNSHAPTTGNDAVIGIAGVMSGPSLNLSESYANFLGAPLINNQVYKLTFWANQFVGDKLDPIGSPTTTQSFNTYSVPIVLSFATSSVMGISPIGTYPWPPVNNVVISTTLSNTFNTWVPYTYTFTYTSPNAVNGNVLYVGTDNVFTPLSYVNQMSSVPSSNYFFYTLLDDISIKPIGSAVNFNLPATKLCSAQGYTDLAQYVSTPNGTFSGVGVTSVANGTNVPTYNFNAPTSTLSAGNYVISYSYTDNIGCTQTIWQQVTIGTTNNGVVLNYVPASSCVNSGTLSVLSPTAGLSYSWQPGSANTNSIAVSASLNTIYTASAISTSSCSYTGTLLVLPNIPTSTVISSAPINCWGATLTALGNFTSAVWQPGNLIGSPVVTPPGTPGIYTVTITNALGCTSTNTVLANSSSNTFTLSSSSPSVCPNGSVTLTAQSNLTISNVVWSPGGSTSNPAVFTPSASTVYSANLSNVNGCFTTGTVAVTVPNLSISASSYTACPGNPSTLTAVGSFTSIVWNPGGYTVNPIVVSPTINTTYSATISNSLGCSPTLTLAVSMVTNCCHSQAYTTFTSTSVSSSTLSAPLLIQNSFTLQANQTLNLLNSEFLFSPNVTVTISSGASLKISGSHLYACNDIMWNGIVVLDGGQVLTEPYSLIEDAKTAIDVTNYTTSTNTMVLNLKKTTFNKNFVDVNISNYTQTLTSYPFIINNCVFTCRNIPFTSTSWPQTGATSSVNTASADLRYVSPSTPTTGLVSPYLTQSGFTVTNLKSPYNTRKSYTAINLNNVGVSTSTLYGIQFGGSGNATDFNLFDSHAYFIYAQNSNVTCYNAVFQNTQLYQQVAYLQGHGGAIYHTTSGVMNTLLDLSATNPNVGCRFWNCHSAIKGTRIYKFWMENAIFRSTQSSTQLPTTNFLPAGNLAISLSTNRFDYYMANSEFSNINNPINVAIVAGSYTAGTTGTVTQNGIYANRVRVTGSLFTNSSSTNAYLNNAVIVTGPNSIPWFVPTMSISPFAQGIIVTNNTLTNVYRGVSVNGTSGFQVDIEENKIGLKNDNVFTQGQYGIQLLNSIPTSSTLIGKNIIASNTASYTSSSYTTGAYGSLIFCGNNGYGVSSPSVTCNNVTQGYQGIVFDQTNKNAVWAGNTMQLPLARGMVLDHAGAIGTQGGLSTASRNLWTGGTWTVSNGNYGTFIGSNSNSQSSFLWVKNGSTYPPASNGSVANNLWYIVNTSFSLATGGDYDCNGISNNKITLPHEEDFISADQYYMDKTALYRFLHFNDSVTVSDAVIHDFYATLSGSSIDKFMQVEEKLYQGYRTEAMSINNGITATNTIETNYKTYYSLYSSFMANDFLPTSVTDSTALRNLAGLCPGTNGACIYQAIALYNAIYGINIIPRCDDGGGARVMNVESQKMTEDSKKLWDVSVFPNPAVNQVTIVSKMESELLEILIKDLSGRVILTQNLKTIDFFGNLDLSLINGAYLITVSNANNETVTKKLLIAK